MLPSDGTLRTRQRRLLRQRLAIRHRGRKPQVGWKADFARPSGFPSGTCRRVGPANWCPEASSSYRWTKEWT